MNATSILPTVDTNTLSQASRPAPSTGAVQPSASNPYVGPVPFRRGDSLYGREREIRELGSLLTSKRIALLISPSGAGKTSLIQAGLIPRLESTPRTRLQCHPVIRLGCCSDGLDGCNGYALDLMRTLESTVDHSGDRLHDSELAALTLDQYAAKRLADDPGKLHLFVFDQFEELFTLRGSDWKQKREFLRQLGEMLGARSLPAFDPTILTDEASSDTESITRRGDNIWVLLSMREDHVAELEPFRHFFPTGLSFRYRLLPLEAEPAREAVEKPAGGFFDPEAARVLVDDLRAVQRGAGSSDLEAERFLGRYVEPMLLQVTCRRLWERIVEGKGRVVPVGDIRGQGTTSEVDELLVDYFDAAVAQVAPSVAVQRKIRD